MEMKISTLKNREGENKAGASSRVMCFVLFGFSRRDVLLADGSASSAADPCNSHSA